MPTPIKHRPQKQKYRCQFCKFRGLLATVTTHEVVCWFNPERFCEMCQNKGYYTECHGDLIEEGDCGLSEDFPCQYCLLWDKDSGAPKPAGFDEAARQVADREKRAAERKADNAKIMAKKSNSGRPDRQTRFQIKRLGMLLRESYADE